MVAITQGWDRAAAGVELAAGRMLPIAGAGTLSRGAALAQKHPAPPAAAGGDPKGWWRLVWCHERCHKPENEARCRAIKRDIQAKGASLICLKKANQFVTWLSRGSRPQFVLLTDWREAQPCVQFLAQKDSSLQPSLVVVVCSSAKQFSRASAWALVLPADIARSVVVCEQTSVPQDLLDGVVKRHFGEALQPPPGLLDGSRTPPRGLEHSLLGDGECRGSSAADEDTGSEDSWLGARATEGPQALCEPPPFTARNNTLPASKIAPMQAPRQLAPVKLSRERNGGLVIVSTDGLWALPGSR